MKLTLDIEIDGTSEMLLKEISLSEEPDTYTFETDCEQMDELFSKGLISSIVSEQFYLTRLGVEYLKQKND